jgi:hypothetical protein
MPTVMDRRQTALLQIGQALRESGYRFITPTPATHARVFGRRKIAHSGSLTDIFGWSRSFLPGDLAPELLDRLDRAGALTWRDGRLSSAVRFSSIGALLVVHSAYPTRSSNAVFFGPDTYRFARAIAEVRAGDRDFAPHVVVDIGAGTGAGGLLAAALFPGARKVVLADINDQALALSEVNAALNGVSVAQGLRSDVLGAFEGSADLIVSNPPYLVDEEQRAYRHGGGPWGCDLAIRIVTEGMERLSGDGKFLLYTGTPVVGGTDMFLEAVRPHLERTTAAYRYEELDPDVFGEELDRPPYDRADRIAAVMLLIDAEDIRGKS